MAETYNYHKRIQNESWLIVHIETLISEAKKNNNSSFVLYAAFEIRNLIEKISYNLLIMSANKSEWEVIEKTAKDKQGIRRSNDKYKALKYRFQTFSEAIGKLADLPIKAFDYKKAEELENDLGEYVHTYTRSQSDMNFDSDFIKNGIKKVEESLQFVRSYFVKDNENYVFGCLNFSTLTGAYKTEFDNWKSGATTDRENLYNKLVEINRINPIVINK